MQSDRELMQQALEALELHAKQYPHMQKGYTVDAITALRERLAQPVQEPECCPDTAKCLSAGVCIAKHGQEPVAWMQEMPTKGDETRSVRLTTVESLAREEWPNPIPLYTTPPRREWVGLTEEDFSAINQSCLTKLQAATSAESILKEKNSA